MKQPLSPKKYIETKARSLPIHKCLVNKEWQTAALASVVVMRRHVNSNVTAGVYLVDLKCLGVKDTIWFFNETEAEIMENLDRQGLPFIEIDYALAHNIIYAGHDFAMEFDIHPVKEFATSRFILEEDTDDIPLIEIETGNDGTPHLFANEPGQYAEALAKLKKHAGEGNYRYTVLNGKSRNFSDKDDFDEEDDFDEDEGDDEDDESPELSLSEIEDGELDLINIRDVHIDNLLDENLVSSRNEMEQMLCKAELLIRSFNVVSKASIDETLDIDDEWEMFPDSGTFDTGMNEESYEMAMEQIADNAGELMVFVTGSPEIYRIKERYLQSNKNNPLFVCLLLEYELLSRNEDTRALLHPYIRPLATVPIVQLILALESILLKEKAEEWQQIIQARNADDAMPQLSVWGETELLYFWAIQIIRHVREGKLPEAVAYYDLFSGVDDALLHLPLVFVIYDILLPPLEDAFLKDVKSIIPTEYESDN